MAICYNYKRTDCMIKTDYTIKVVRIIIKNIRVLCLQINTS